MPECSGGSLATMLHLESRIEACTCGRKSVGGSVSASFADAKKKGSCGVGASYASQSIAFSSSSSLVLQVGMLPFLDQWRGITSNRFVLNMVQGHHLQLRSHPPLFCNFWQFNVKAAAGHHPIIQKEVDDLLATGEPSSGVLVSISVCLLFLSILVVSGSCLSLSSLIIICTSLLLRYLLSDMSSNLLSMVIMLSLLISRMLIDIFLLLSIIIFFTICLARYAISVESFTFWASHSP